MFFFDPEVINGMNQTNLKYFKIYGLFHRYNVALTFDREVNIYIGENGLGKTTILNCLYYVLEKKLKQLEEVVFDSIEIKFQNSRTAHAFSKADLIAYNRKRNSTQTKYEEDFLTDLLFELNISFSDFAKLPVEETEPLLRRYARIQGIPYPMLRRAMAHYSPVYAGKKGGDPDKVQKLIGAVDSNIHERIIYLPTYRRIENDFSNLNIGRNELTNSEMLIRFGMADVQKSIDTVLGKIRTLAMQGFNKMTGLLLQQYASGEIMTNRSKAIDVEVVKIVLDRLGEEVEEVTKQEIINLIESHAITNRNNLHLLNLLHKLVSNYDEQKHYDDCINRFVYTCNKYLQDKHFNYDPSKLTLDIFLDGENEVGKTVKLTQLSSGEKQIVSLFSKLYLEGDAKSIVIIDEPELSLSLTWQQMLLPDIMRSGNCSFLLTVTHSPFIFHNEFDMDACEMRKYMERF